jgi:hypothetical protein
MDATGLNWRRREGGAASLTRTGRPRILSAGGMPIPFNAAKV